MRCHEVWPSQCIGATHFWRRKIYYLKIFFFNFFFYLKKKKREKRNQRSASQSCCTIVWNDVDARSGRSGPTGHQRQSIASQQLRSARQESIGEQTTTHAHSTKKEERTAYHDGWKKNSRRLSLLLLLLFCCLPVYIYIYIQKYWTSSRCNSQFKFRWLSSIDALLASLKRFPA